MRKIIAAAMLASIAVPVVPAFADPPYPASAHKKRAHHAYDSHGRYIQPRPITRRDRIWRGRDGRYYCRRDNGTTGLVIGAAIGGLIGNQLAGEGDKTLGTIIGAVGGGVIGRAIDRGELKCR